MEPWKIHPIKDQHDTDNLDGSEISKSERFKILGKDATDVTRTGKPIDDLDHSDLTAMNYMNFTAKLGPEDETKLGPEDETIIGCNNHQKQSKVSFHHNTTVHDGSQAEHGVTKTGDGKIEGRLNPNQTPYFWTQPDDSFEQKVGMKRLSTILRLTYSIYRQKSGLGVNLVNFWV